MGWDIHKDATSLQSAGTPVFQSDETINVRFGITTFTQVVLDGRGIDDYI